MISVSAVTHQQARLTSAGVRREKVDLRRHCEICMRSTEPGWLWLGGADWAQCPQCCGTGFVVYNRELQMPTRKVSLPGVRK